MIRKTLAWLAAWIGYLVYTLAVLAVLLWLLFPQEKVRDLIVRQLNAVSPGLHWKVSTSSLRLSDGITLQAIEGYEQGTTSKPLIRIESLHLRPDIKESMNTKRLVLAYDLDFAKGTVAGTLVLQRKSREVLFNGTMRGLQLDAVQMLSRQLQRKVQGTVSGSFRGTMATVPFAVAAMAADLQVENGQAELKQPVLGNAVIPFSRATVAVQLKDGKVNMEHGTVQSQLFTGTFSGEIKPGRDVAASTLAIRGALNPQAEFFRRIRNPMAVQTLRSQLKGKSLPFQVSGTLQNPGIYFEEYSMLFESLQKELK